MSLVDLWLPILLSGVFVFVVSSVIHMVLPMHKGDYGKLPAEEQLLEAMRGESVQPGQYMFPCPQSMADMASPEMVEKFKQGPVGTMIVRPSGPPTIGKQLLLWFLFSLVISAFVAHLACLSLEAGAAFDRVFHVTGNVALVGYALSYIPDSIWKGLGWNVTLKFVLDGIAYAATTGATFAWLWPAAGQ